MAAKHKMNGLFIASGYKIKKSYGMNFIIKKITPHILANENVNSFLYTSGRRTGPKAE